jgi:hypothetical protein
MVIIPLFTSTLFSKTRYRCSTMVSIAKGQAGLAFAITVLRASVAARVGWAALAGTVVTAGSEAQAGGSAKW